MGRRAAWEASVLEIKGVAPTQQARSKATFQALIQAGMRVIESKGLRTIDIAEISKAAGVSIGAFYDRFENKEAFLAALKEIAADDIVSSVRQTTARQGFASLGDVDAVATMVGAWLQRIRQHRGLINATLGHIWADPKAWTPLRLSGRRVANIFVEVLGPRMQARGLKSSESDIRIAMQFMFGLVMNSILIDPGPVTLDQQAMQQSIVKHFSRFLEL